MQNTPKFRNSERAHKAPTLKEKGPTHTPKVLAYQRVSLREDATGSHTFETQSLRITEKLDQLYGKDNYDLEVLTDNGVSGALGLSPTAHQRRTRPTLRKIADKLASGDYDCFIVYSFSRLARSPQLFHELLNEVILPSRVDFVSVTQDVNLGRADGRAMAGMLAVFDGFYRDSVIERCIDAASTRAEQGYYVGQVGYGWAWEPLSQVPDHGRRRIRPVPEQGRWIIQMKDWYLAGWSLPRICGELNSLGVPSASGKSRWSSAVLRRILHNPVHAGLVPVGRHGQEWRPGEHSEHRYFATEVLDQLKESSLTRNRWKTNAIATTDHLLNSLVFCKNCGARLYVSSANSVYRAYRCERGMTQGQRSCPNVSVRADALEATVIREIEQLVLQPAMRQLLLEEASKAGEIEVKRLQMECAQLRERSVALEARFERLAEAYGDEDETLSKEDFRRLSAKSKGEREIVKTRLETNEAALANRHTHSAWIERVQSAVLDLPVVWPHL